MRQKSLHLTFCLVYSGNWKKGIIKITSLLTILLGLFVQANAQLSVTIEYTSQMCGSTGTADATAYVNGGTPPYTYQWSNGATTQTNYALGVGMVTVTVTDASTQTNSASKNIVAPPEIVLTIDGADGDCYQGSNDLTATVNGGVPPYSFQWSNGSSNQVVFNPSTGYYFVTVTDANGCFKVGGKNVVGAMEAQLIGSTVSCADDCDGSVAATVVGGEGPYTYQWDNGFYPTSSIQSVAPIGVYNITITDANGCTVTGQTEIGAPPPIEGTITLENPCASTTAGTVQATGGNPPYTYFWSNGHLGQTHSYLTTGEHKVTITDANNCEMEVITQVVASDMAIEVVPTQADCFGGSTGTASISMTGGSGTAEYIWSNGQTAPTAIGLAPGEYDVTVTDMISGCERYKTFQVESSTGLELTLYPEMIDCDGNGGNANVDVLGGTPPFNFAWSNGMTTQQVQSIEAGDYTVVVTDVYGCTGEAQLQMEEMNDIEVSMTSMTASKCDTDGGAATVAVTGGLAPYTFEWNGQFVAESTMENLVAGTNTVIIHDANNCKRTLEFEIEDESMNLIVEVMSEGCPGMNNATAQASIMGGGQPPFSYAWSNGKTTQISEDLPVGMHTVTVTDANGCAETINVEVEPVPEMSVVVDITPTACGGAETGAASAEVVSGGNGPYTFAWSNAGNSAAIGGLGVGQYTLMVTDANGCEQEVIIAVEEEELELSVNVEDPICIYGNDGMAQAAIISGGQAPYNYAWSNGATGAIANNLEVGEHTLVVTDASGCEQTFEFSVASTTVLASEFIYGTADCSDDGVQLAFTDVSANTSQGTAPASWLWTFSDGQTSTEQNPMIWTNNPNLTAQLVVTDAQGCSQESEQTFEVATIDVSLASEALGCYGENFTVEAIINNDADDLVFNWSPASMILAGNGTPNPTISTAQMGEFTLQVSILNASGCSIENEMTVSIEEVVELDINSINYAQCNSLTVDFINLNTADVDCEWYFDYPNTTATSTAANPSHTYTAPGEYTVALVPLEDCHEPILMPVTVAEAPVIEIAADAEDCQEVVTVQFNDMSQVNNGIQSWSWDFGTLGTSPLPNPSLTVTESQVIEATLTIEFNNGCVETVSTTVPINVYTEPNLEDSFFSCTGQDVELNPNGNGAYTYQWTANGNASISDPTAMNPTASLTETTTFIVEVANPNGSCATTQEVTVEVPDEILTMQPLPDLVLCEDVEVNMTADVVGATTIQWSTDETFNNIISTEETLTVMAGEPTTYYVMVSSDDGCDLIQDATIGNYSPELEFAETMQVCENQKVTWNDPSINPNSIMSWTPFNPIETAVANSGEFTFTMDVGAECPAVGEFDMTVIPFAFDYNIDIEATELLEGETTQLTVTNHPSFVYNWTPATGLSGNDIYNPIARPLQTTTYNVNVIDSETNCSGHAQVEIKVEDAICDEPYIFVPNAFTPNGDGKNDVLYVRGVNLDKVYFAVYDRWGEMVFETEDLDKGWDGSFKGEKVTGDAYGYYLKAICFGGQQFFKKGNVTVLK